MTMSHLFFIVVFVLITAKNVGDLLLKHLGNLLIYSDLL